MAVAESLMIEMRLTPEALALKNFGNLSSGCAPMGITLSKGALMKRFDFSAGLAMLLAVFLLTACNDNNSVSGDDHDTADSEHSIGDSGTGAGGDSSADSVANTDIDSASSTETASETESDTDDLAMPEETRSALAWNDAPDISDDDYGRFIDNTNQFGFKLFHQLNHGEENLVFSPVSIATALGMTLAGAVGKTKDEMSQALQNDLSDAIFHAAGNRLLIELASRNIQPHESAYDKGEKEVQLSLVNAIFAQHDFAIESPFLDVLGRNYDSGVRLLDFQGAPDSSRVAINEWVADNTNRKIEDLIPAAAITADTRMVLTNALYFYGSWQNTFMEQTTRDDVFNTLGGAEITVPMMQIDTDFYCGEGDGFQIIDIPYDGNALVMTVVLPDTGKFESIRDAADAVWMTEAVETLSRGQRVLRIPRFGFHFGSVSLKEALGTLGMHDAFEKDLADFTGIHAQTPERLYVSDVVHKAFIGIDEYGTEAAAATAVMMAGYTSMPPEFKIDRPFLFFIRDKASGLILFAGQVVDPS